MIIIVIVLIIALVWNTIDYRKLMKKYQNLKKEFALYKENNNVQISKEAPAQLKDTSPIENVLNKETVKSTNNINSEIKPKKDYINNTKKTNKPKDDEGIKNKFVLMSGAILIVLAAIVFLTSTWHTIPNVVKTSIIILLTGIFIGASNIAKKIFKLEETANTFLYIALAYLPISLFSISLFGLIGEFFSIHGNGNYFYFAISTVFLATLYFMLGNRRKQIVLIHSSMIMQLLAIIFISLCISTNLNIVMLGIIIYNTIILILKKKYFNKYLNILNIYNDIYLYTAFIIEIFLLISGNLAVDIISNALLIFNFYLKYRENKNYINTLIILTQILILAVSCLNMTANIFEVQIRQVIFYILLIVVYLFGMLNKKIDWKKSSMLVVTIAMILLYISTFMFSSIDLILKRYIILWTIAILNIINYNLSEQKNLFINLIPIGIFLAQINTIIENNLNINYLIFLELGLFAFSILNLLKDKKSNLVLQNYSNILTIISIVFGFIINYNNMISNTIIFILLMIVYGVGYFKNNQIKIYKFIAYFLLNIILYSILYKFNILQYSKYIVASTTVIITLIELFFNKINDDITLIYLISSYVLSYMILNIDINIIPFGSILVLNMLFILYIKNKNVDKNLILLPFGALLPSVYFSNWAIINNINLMFFVSFILIFITTILSVKEKKLNIYTLISAVYILMQIYMPNLSVYINIILAILWSVLHLIKKPEHRVKFEITSYIWGLILYNTILKDCSKINANIDSITAFRYLGYIIFTICITRNIIKKHSADGYKVIEYIAFSMLYLSAIQNYVSEMDGMIFVFMLVCIIIVSYIKKFGPIFFTSTVAVILNSFLLTREFWFSVPWWIYMLIIGCILIIFAVKNELNENKNRELIKNKMKSFKTYIDM